MLYQPTDVIPSTFSGFGSGVVSANDPFSVSFRVNGNSPMTAFMIEIFENTPESALVHSTGILSAKTASHPSGFYGTDNRGNPIPFLFPDDIGAPSVTFGNIGIQNGNEYKLKITLFWGNQNENSVSQSSESVFFARAKATVTLDPFPSVVDTSEITFTATYNQNDGDSINYVRFQFASVDGEGNRTILDDTGEIYTGNLSYSYSGLLTGNTYSINCFAQTQFGYITPDNWTDFTVFYEEAEGGGNIQVECLSTTGGNLISWPPGLDIPGKASPETDFGQIKNGKLLLNSNATVTWDTVSGEPMDFKPNYSIGLKTENLTLPITPQNPFASEGTCSLITVSSEETMLAAVFPEENQTTLRIYSISENLNLIFQTTVSGTVETVSFSPLSGFLFFGGNSENFLYKIENASFLNCGSLHDAQGIPVSGTVFCSVFLSETETDAVLLCGGDFENTMLIGAIEKSRPEMNFSPPSHRLLSGEIPKFFDFSGTEIVCTVDSDSGSFLKFYSTSGRLITYLYEQNLDFKAKKAKFFSEKLIAFGERAALFLKTDSVYDFFSYIAAMEEKADSIFDILEANGYFILAAQGTYGYLFTENRNAFSFSAELTDEGIRADGYSFSLAAMQNRILIGGSFSGGDIAFVFRNDSFLELFFSSNPNGFLVYNQAGILKILSDTTLIFETPLLSSTAYIGISPDSVSVSFENREGIFKTVSQAISVSQAPISSIVIRGEMTFDFVFVSNGIFDFTKNPVWNSDMLFFANWNENSLQAGTISAGVLRNAVFRLHEGEISLFPVYKVPTMITAMKDFTAKSQTAYVYEMFYMTENRSYSAPVRSDPVCFRSKSFFLYEASPDSEFPDVFHVEKIFRFGNNIEAGSVSNNNAPNFLLNFTPYRLRQPSSQMGKSGTLSALLSNFENGSYSDSVSMMEALFEASRSQNSFFLKDMKGNLYHVHIAAPIVQTVNTKSSLQEVSVSIPWEEIGNADGISLIQTPLDPGWNNNMVFGVKMNADVYTGNLSVSYPENYSGTTFEMNSELLIANTPRGITKVDFQIDGGTLSVSERL